MSGMQELIEAVRKTSKLYDITASEACVAAIKEYSRDPDSKQTQDAIFRAREYLAMSSTCESMVERVIFEIRNHWPKEAAASK